LMKNKKDIRKAIDGKKEFREHFEMGGSVEEFNRKQMKPSIASLMQSEARQLIYEDMKYTEVEGDLITLAKKGKFDVITHGCNCQSIMSAGIAVPMNLHFDASRFPMELQGKSMLKLGNIDCQSTDIIADSGKILTVVNSYTQNYPNVATKPLDYEALALCMRKINHKFKGQHIGLPKIGCGLAGGDWDTVREIIKAELKDCDITIVIYKR
jgi:O-acetyl-ADP-ribose deacetylase (regulator of RNase III)